MSGYVEVIRQELLRELENKEITEDEFWEYYKSAMEDYSESQQAEYYMSIEKC